MDDEDQRVTDSDDGISSLGHDEFYCIKPTPNSTWYIAVRHSRIQGIFNSCHLHFELC